MCFFLSSRSGSFRIPYVNETIYIHSSGKSTLLVELLINTKKETRSIDIIYPNTSVEPDNLLDQYKEFSGYDKLSNIYTISLIYPKKISLEGHLNNYVIMELYEHSDAHKGVLETMNFSIFTIVFETPLKPNTSTWVRIGFTSPFASNTKDIVLRKRNIDSLISGPVNTKRAFEQRCEIWLDEVINSRKKTEYELIDAHTIELALNDIKNTIISSFEKDTPFEIDQWNLSVIPQPNIAEFSINIKSDSEIKETEDIDKPNVKWPFIFFPYRDHIPKFLLGVLDGLLKGVYGYLDMEDTKQHSFYFTNNHKLPKFQIGCSGVYEKPYLTIIAILALIPLISFILNTLIPFILNILK